MRKSRLLTSIAFSVVLHFGVVYGQNTVDNTKNRDLIDQYGPQSNIFGFQDAQVEAYAPIKVTNRIYIEQIGVQNQVQVRTRTNHSNIDLVQRGRANTTRIDASALSITDNIQQSGDNHFFAEYSNTPSMNMQRSINQSGSGQSLMIHGNNSMSEKIRLNMEGNSKTIIIRNFN